MNSTKNLKYRKYSKKYRIQIKLNYVCLLYIYIDHIDAKYNLLTQKKYIESGAFHKKKVNLTEINIIVFHFIV